MRWVFLSDGDSSRCRPVSTKDGVSCCLPPADSLLSRSVLHLQATRVRISSLIPIAMLMSSRSFHTLAKLREDVKQCVIQISILLGLGLSRKTIEEVEVYSYHRHWIILTMWSFRRAIATSSAGTSLFVRLSARPQSILSTSSKLRSAPTFC